MLREAEQLVARNLSYNLLAGLFGSRHDQMPKVFWLSGTTLNITFGLSRAFFFYLFYASQGHPDHAITTHHSGCQKLSHQTSYGTRSSPVPIRP
ncbi:hypothetical protein BDV36DRAFT_133085 [Aspergillus pseudocaelatus]|uniref:Uncharacterized protein n=1 Tax=Aspergillus pseudocaelatus TaxID=1825620 RepID=A0ABQ6X256_9EURO|nr:hypothetical protein BDV36DRAFT_133085 [Aspergillus pseudocaelatus]